MRIPDDVNDKESFQRGVNHVLNALDAFSRDLRENDDPHKTHPKACPDCGTKQEQVGIDLICPKCDL